LIGITNTPQTGCEVDPIVHEKGIVVRCFPDLQVEDAFYRRPHGVDHVVDRNVPPQRLGRVPVQLEPGKLRLVPAALPEPGRRPDAENRRCGIQIQGIFEVDVDTGAQPLGAETDGAVEIGDESPEGEAVFLPGPVRIRGARRKRMSGKPRDKQDQQKNRDRFFHCPHLLDPVGEYLFRNPQRT
jgi:hypothetical protein